MNFKLLFLFTFVYSFCVSCRSNRTLQSTYQPQPVYSDSQRHADYNILTKGTFLETVTSTPKTYSIAEYPYCIGTAGQNTYLYEDSTMLKPILVFSPSQQFAYYNTTNKVIRVAFGTKQGYVARVAIEHEQPYTSIEYKAITWHSETGTYDYVPKINNLKSSRRSSSYSSGSTISSSAKTVHVNGYYRKNGTYVHSYYRRSPSRY